MLGLGADTPIIQEEHPVNHRPYYCFHICHIQDVIRLLHQHPGHDSTSGGLGDHTAEADPKEKREEEGEGKREEEAVLTLLNMLVYMGRYLGAILVTPSMYTACVDTMRAGSHRYG